MNIFHLAEQTRSCNTTPLLALNPYHDILLNLYFYVNYYNFSRIKQNGSTTIVMTFKVFSCDIKMIHVEREGEKEDTYCFQLL